MNGDSEASTETWKCVPIAASTCHHIAATTITVDSSTSRRHADSTTDGQRHSTATPSYSRQQPATAAVNSSHSSS